MRSLLVMILAAALAISAVAQQQQTPSAQQSQPQNQQPKKPAKQPQPPAKPEEQATKPTEPAPPQPEPKASDDKKEEHYDMAEVPPVVTHHEIKMDGKSLKYTATAGRLPIKRGDGKVEAEMFFKLLVLRSHYGKRQRRAHFIQRNPVFAEAYFFIRRKYLLNRADNHERSKWRGHKTKKYNRGNT